MRMRRIWHALILAMACTGIAAAATLPGELNDRLETDRYDCVLDLLPGKSLAADAVRVTLEADADKNGLYLTLTRNGVTIQSVGGTKRTTVARVANPGVTPGKPYHFTIMRRERSLGLLHDDSILFRGDVPRGPGKLIAVTMDGKGGSGWSSASDPRIQRLEPIHFEDDFMRTKDEDPGSWVKQSGNWLIKSAWDETPQGNAGKFSNVIFAQNPFAWVGRYEPGKVIPAVCTVGDSFWEDYTFSVAIQPSEDGAAGIVFNMPDAHSGLLVRWTPVDDQGRPGRLTLCRVDKDKILAPIATSPGGYLPGQWYNLTVASSLDGLSVLVDGTERIKKEDITPWRGGIGLYAEGERGIIFDDVKVFGRTFDSDLLFETLQTDVNQRFENDLNGMGNWANPKSEWNPGLPAGLFWYRHDLFGNHIWMNMSVKPLPGQTGELRMTLNGDGQNAAKGLRAVVQTATAPPGVTYTLYQDDTVLARSQSKQPLTADSDYSIRFWRVGTALWLEVDGETVVKATVPGPITGLCPAYLASGTLASARDQIVLSHNMLDYTFSTAPADWLTEGTWMPTNRWACEPKWSFLAGWSRGDAAMWHKQRFIGDHSFEAFMGPKMEYPRERDVYDNRYRDFSITICGDGQNPRSGYTGTFATLEADGARRMVLYRDGVEVAQLPLEPRLIPTRGNHRSWFDLELRKRGNTVEFLVTFAWIPKVDPATGQKVSEVLRLAFADSKPIDGGVPAIWTNNNGINISRARIRFANPPQARADALVSISDVWYPEWANLGQPLNLDFSRSWSTAGKPLRLTVLPHTAPPGDGPEAIKVDGTRLAFTPQKSDVNPRDAHWYEIVATDGEHKSPGVHLDLHVFDPAHNKRDDSHALILYRFDEGQGAVVRDQSGKAPAANLEIEKDAAGRTNIQWLPGQGLSVNLDSRVSTGKEGQAGMDKLLGMKTTHACTVEFWVSTDTVYPPIKQELGWASYFLSWDNPAAPKDTQRNLAILQSSTSLLYCPRDVPVANNGVTAFPGTVRTGLAHYVLASDGEKRETTIYLNGMMLGKKPGFPLNEAQMTPGGALVLGNNAGNPVYAFTGTFYLLAIHDRCFTLEDAVRHYNAGPSGR